MMDMFIWRYDMSSKSIFLSSLVILWAISLNAMQIIPNCFDQKFLNKRVAAYVSEITSGGHITQECIRRDMQFLSNSSSNNEVLLSYADQTNFDKKLELYSKNEKAKEFLSCCKEVYNNGSILQKIQVYIFMERVCSLLCMFSGVASGTFFTNVFD